MNRICDICNEVVTYDTWVYQISDDKEKIEVSGHKICIDKYELAYKSIKNYSQKSVKQVQKELKLHEKRV